uniref:Uncharacterized protein n=1 Tax=Anguilla anguilla TaxID=7936 RepID=A0A0E9XFC8_ANGAN
MGKLLCITKHALLVLIQIYRCSFTFTELMQKIFNSTTLIYMPQCLHLLVAAP